MEPSALVYVLLTAVTVLLGLCVDNRRYVPGYISGRRNAGTDRRQARNHIAVFAVFCLMAGVSACRIAVGNDYWVYRDNFKLIAQGRYVSYEPGFNLIVKWIQQIFGYDHYLPVFGFFSIVTVFFFVRALEDQGSDFAVSLFLLLTGGYYFNSLNTVRYYLALAIALYAMKYVLRGEYGKFILWILAGAMFHKSILLVIPVYLLARFLAAAKLKKWHYITGGIFVASLIFCQSFYQEIIFYFYPYYRDSMFDAGQLSYVNIVKCVCVLILCGICYKKSLTSDLNNRFYFFLNIAGLVVYCCGSFIPEVSRVGYYMIISQVFLLPRLLEDMREGVLKKLCCMGVIVGFALYFLLLLRGMYAVDVRLLPYLNWIFD
ncbi:MAG: EpsG family protein [Eubacterium sp.]|nr:EpsG family protein [Eubacterium sp.]MCM1213762.1 EpsG family protein [Lachnospiraceae bacterium]MCM1303360.1 EpsG family protein [Butyrivibrio sp.]MCM1342950.1 EpsG family protein [Muribaculaceae bacterium]MCM1237881.1 EpsG family protein [Lachnospiraceae bacterium]